MAEFVGSSLNLQWIYSGGTVTLSPDFRSCSWQPSIDSVETTAGSDTAKSRLTTVKDANASISGVRQSGGTQVVTALDAGVSGTLLISPEGTATGKRKITFPSFSNGAQDTIPYAGIVEYSCSFTENAAYTDGSW